MNLLPTSALSAALRRTYLFVAIMALALVPLLLHQSKAQAAACTVPTTDYGTVSGSVSVPSSATYRIWSRINVPSSTANTYLLQVDGNQCFNVGGGALATGSWQWVAYQGGNTTSRTDMALTQGTHTIQLIGNAANVMLDRVIFVSDLNCVPTGTGDNCNLPDDTSAPAVAVSSPAPSATVSGTITAVATASDNVGVVKVEGYYNSTLFHTEDTTPYTFPWDTTKVPNGDQLLTFRAYDAAGNVGVASIHVNVQNGDVQAPSVPSGLSARATAYNAVALTWSGSTDNVGVTGYTVYRGGVPIATTGNVTSYNDTGLTANTTYSYYLQAIDAAGNRSPSSASVSVTTPNVADTQAPTAPSNLSASAVSSSQINVSWSGSTDNIGVAGYDVYRSSPNTGAAKVATVTSLSYGDANLASSTTYTYYVVARDAAGNSSSQSVSTSATTLSNTPDPTYSVSGTIKNKSKKVIPYATVSYTLNGVDRTIQADSRGFYMVQGLSNGRYRFTYQAAGYSSTDSNIRINGTNVVKNITLR